MLSRRNLGILAVALVAVATFPSAQGYYHFVQYAAPTASGYRPIPQKFDLSSLVNNTVTYVISQTGPDKLAAGDTLAALATQIHNAARTWSAVPTSQIRLAFGGFVKAGTPVAGPEIEIIFDDLPPGVLGFGGPSSNGDLAGPDGAHFVPIVKSTLILPKDISARPSWTEAQFLTITHEMGHTLGLQHTQASSVMSTEVTRGTTKAMPLADDDRAGLSVLYPTTDFAARFGTITGRVTAGTDGMNLASVLALTADGTAITALTNPDGTYRMDGVPAGNYYLYVHPLPPPMSGQVNPDGLTLPVDANGNAIALPDVFDSQFFPGVQLADDASILVVKAGTVSDRIDFQVTKRAGIPVYGVTSYSFPGQVAVKPAFLSPVYARNLMVATGIGLTTPAGTAVAAGLSASVLGPTAAVSSTRFYSAGYVQFDMQFGTFPGEGARHMIFRSGGVTHVLPAALRLVAANPPVVTELAAVKDDAGNSLLEVRGTGFTKDSRVLFDGVVVPVSAFTATALRVTPPVAPPGYKASVVVLNPDGQSSLFLAASPAVYSYAAAAGADVSVSLSPSVLTPGTETFVDINGTGTAFNSSSTLNFGTSDIVVRRFWVLGPQRIVANVIALGGAVANTATGKLPFTVTTGLRDVVLIDGLQIAKPPARVVSVTSAIVDDATGRGAISPGFAARVSLSSNIAANLTPASFAIKVSGIVAPAISFANSVLVFRMPVGLGPGPGVVEITAASEPLPNVLAMVDLPPPIITSATPGTTARPAGAGDLITLRVTGLVEGADVVDIQRLQVTVNNTVTQVVQSTLVLAPSIGGALGHDIQFQLDAKQAPGTLPVIVAIDGRPSAPFNIVVK